MKEVQPLAKILGNSIVNRRKLLEMSQAELAERLDMAPGSLSRIENGFVAPRFGLIEEIARHLHCSASELFRDSNSRSSNKSESIADLISHLPEDKQNKIVDIVARISTLI